MISSNLSRLRRIARWHRNRSGQRVVILLYHRVAELCSDPGAISVTPQHFAEHLKVLLEYARPIRLQALSAALSNGYAGDRHVVVAFDDGYSDNLYNAKPILERYNVPATVFVTTGHLGHNREFWWDTLDRLLLQPGTLPETLSLTVNESTYQWELGEAAQYSEGTFRRNQNWRTWKDAPPSPRHLIYRSLWELLQPLAEDKQRKVLDELLVWAGAEPVADPAYSTLSHEELFALGQGEHIEVGAHTVTHPKLSALSAASQHYEIQQSKAQLEEVLDHPVTSFAYPYGTRSDYTAETARIVREAGFTCACSNFAGVVGQATDRFQLPRVHVENWDGEEFARLLSRWFWFSRWFHD
jgi:peptidoglycan/xylan/chitin deacetylase (PgdA/CDA1 family)